MRKIWKTRLLIFIALCWMIINISVGLANPQGDTSIIFERNTNLTPLTVEDDEVIQTAYMRAKLNSQTTELYFNDYWIKSTLINSNRIKSEPVKKGLNDTKKKKLEWVDVVEGVDISQIVYENRLKEDITVKKKNAPVKFVFKLSYSEGLNVIERGNAIVFTDREGTVLVEIEEPFAIDADGKYYPYKYSLVGRNLKLEPITNISDVVYPLVIDPSYIIHESTYSYATNSDGGLARTSNGDLHAVYIRTPTDSYIRPCYARSTDNGHTWTEEQILTTGSHHEYEPSIAVDSENSLHVVWEGYISGYAIAYAMYNGTAWSTPISIGDELGDVEHPSIAIDVNDNIHVVWQDTFTGYANIRYIKYNGSSWSSITNLTASSSYNRAHPSIAIDYNNYLHVVWYGHDGTDYQIYYRRSTTSGESWDATDKITSESDTQSSPQIAIDTENNLHVVFGGYGSWGSDRRIRYMKYDSSWSAITDLDTYAYYQGDPTISITQVNNIIDVVWYGAIDVPQIYKILHNQYNGSTWNGVETIVEVSGEYQKYPTSIMAVYPDKCEVNTNVPYTGFAFIYTDNLTVRYYEDSELSWLVSSKYDLTVKARDSVSGNYINNFTADLSTGDSDTTTDGTITFSCLDENQWVTIILTADDYYAGTKDTYISSDKTETLLLNPSTATVYNLTVKARNLMGGAELSNFTVELDTGEINVTTDGSANFTNILSGYREITVTSTGYYPQTKTLYLDTNKTEIVYLTPITETEYFLPQKNLVEFRVQTWQGVPISNVNVTVQGYEITHPQNWLEKLFGYENATEIYSEQMNGTTDSGGSISFLMIATIKYEMVFTKGSEVNETLYIFPKEDHYKIIIGNASWVQTESMWDVVNYSILVNEIPGNDTHSFINFSFVDLNNATSEIYYFINQTNGTTSFNIYNHTYTGGDCANIINSYIVERGEAYLIGFVGQNDDYGVIKYSIFVRIFEKDKRLLEFEGAPDYIYDYISIGLLCLVAAFFGMVTVPEGGIVICLGGWILWFLGWFLWQNPLAPLYLTTATVFAVLIIYTAKGRGKGVS